MRIIPVKLTNFNKERIGNTFPRKPQMLNGLNTDNSNQQKFEIKRDLMRASHIGAKLILESIETNPKDIV